METIRILHVIGKMDRAGAEMMIMNYYRNIDRDKVQFDFLVHTNKKGDFDDEIKALGGKIYYLPQFKGYNYAKYKRACKVFFAKHNEYKAVHGHIGSCASIYLHEAKKKGIFTIAHSHNTADKNYIRKNLYKILTYKTRCVADYFFACSLQAGIDRFGKQVVNQDNFKILKNAINARDFQYTEEKRKKLVKQWNPNNEIIIGHIGRFHKQKNHEFIIEVFDKLSKKYDNIKLYLVGEGEEKEKIQLLVKNKRLNNKVEFLGIRNDINDLMMVFDLFFFPSIYEGLGVVLIEAQAAGLTCIVSEAIVDEAIITQDVIKISLQDSIDIWVTKIEESIKNQKRHNNYEIVKNAHYDIEDAAMKLQEFYIRGRSKDE